MSHRIVDVAAAVGIFADDFAASMAVASPSPGAVAAWASLTQDEPAHVLNADVGGAARIKVVMLDVAAVQLDFALNTIPRASAVLPVGVLGTGSNAGDVFSRLVRQYPIQRKVRARVYVRLDTTSCGPIDSQSDTPPFLYETVMAFDGSIAGTGVDDSGRLVLSLTHVLAALAESSALSAALAPQTAGNLSFNAGQDPFVRPADPSQAGLVANTAFGTVAASLACGGAAETDYWGYWQPDPGWGSPPPPRPRRFKPHPNDFLAQLTLPPEPPPAPPPTFNDIYPSAVPGVFGVQHYYYSVCGQDLFNWNALGDANSATAPNPDTSNNGAVAGLSRTEPFGGSFYKITPSSPDPYYAPYGGPFPVPNGGTVRNNWSVLRSLTAAPNPPASGPVPEAPTLNRADLLAGSTAYYEVGYRYGVPLVFRRDTAPPPGFGAGVGLAADMIAESLRSLGSTTLWDKIVGQQLPKYMLALAPMADRGLVVPLNPTPEATWLTVTVDEIDGYREDNETPTPIQGVILLGRRTDSAGLVGGNDPSGGGPGYGAHAQYNSGLPGQFLTFQAPDWLTGYSTGSWLPGGLTVTGWHHSSQDTRTRKKAADSLTGFVKQAIKAAAAFKPKTPAEPTPPTASAGYRLAQSWWARERLKHHSASFTTGPRFDIAPGSVLTVEVPTDRARPRPPLLDRGGPVTPEAAQARAGYVIGVVNAVSVWIDSESQRASTQISMGHVRTLGEAFAGPLAGVGHPLWRVSWFGAPLADTAWARARLGNNYALG